MPSKPLNPKREEFLISMYERMWENISRSITLSWQPFVLLVALGAIFSAAIAKTIPFWFATTVGIIIVGWFFGHIFDANEWFWRNHLIVANLEYHFMDDADKKAINPFMGELRKPKDAARLFSSMRPHYFLGVALAITIILIEVIFEVVPGVASGAWPTIGANSAPWLLVVPLVATLATVMWVLNYKKGREAQYEVSYELAVKGRL